MIRHVVVFRWAEGTSGEAKEAVSAALAELPALIPEIAAYRFGPDAGLAPGNFDFGVTADFRDEADYLVYRDHPAHRAAIAERISPIVAERAAVQLRLDETA